MGAVGSHSTMMEPNGNEDSNVDVPHATTAGIPTMQIDSNDARGSPLSVGVSPVANGSVQPTRRVGFHVEDMLNEVVDTSDHDDDKDVDNTTSTLPAQSQGSEPTEMVLDATVGPTTTTTVGHDVKFLLLMTHSEAQTDSVTPGGDEGASMGYGNQEDSVMNAIPADMVPTPEAVATGGRPARHRSIPSRYTIEHTPTKPKTKRQETAPIVDTVVGETPPDGEATSETNVSPESPTVPISRPTRNREKRRQQTPSPARAPPPPKKAKPTTATRPKRAVATAVTNYVDVTENDGGESEDGAVMVIVSRDTGKSAKVATSPPLEAIDPPFRVNKRKTMSQRQYDELLADDRDTGLSSPVEFKAPSNTKAHIPSSGSLGPELHPCEFCRKRHSAHTTYLCHQCRRVYHDKCFVDAFKSAIQDDQLIESQMQELSLYRPTDRTPILRCTACQAAFIDLCKNKGMHWDCECPTCTTVPERSADYRRATLRQIIDEHNLEHAMKKEKKGTAAKKPAGKAPTKAPRTKTPPKSATRGAVAASPPSAPTTPPSRARGGKRTRGEETRDEDATLAVGTALVAKASVGDANKKSQSTGRNRRSRGKKATLNVIDDYESDGNTSHPQDTHAMEVDTSVDTKDSSRHIHVEEGGNDGDANMEDVDGEPDTITLQNLEELVAITKENDDTWSFKVACSPSQETNESGTYKEATLYWHPHRHHTVKCSCCEKEDQSIKWFVQHTDATLLTSPGSDDEVNKVYSYIFVLQRDGKMVPLQDVINLIREKHRATLLSQPRAKEGRRPSAKSADKKDTNAGQEEAMTLLRQVRYTPRETEAHGPGKKRVARSKFACEVVCAERKWLKPLKSDGPMLRNVIADCYVSQDVYKMGTFDLLESAKNPKTVVIHCNCCKKLFNAIKFVHHTREPLLLHQHDEVERLKEDSAQKRYDFQEETEDAWNDPNESESPTNVGESGKKIRSFVCVTGVLVHDPLSVMKLETFLGALEKLGNQTQINRTIAAIVKSQETPVPPSSKAL